ACTEAADECRRLADLVARAAGLYADAERTARDAVNQGVRAMALLAPQSVALTALVAAVAGGTISGLKEGTGFSPIGASRATAWMQEGVLAAIGSAALGAGTGTNSLLSILAAGVTRSDGTGTDVNQGLVGLAPWVAAYGDLKQGDHLTLTQVDTGETGPVGAAGGVADALHGLRLLGEANGLEEDGLSYATIAISRYDRPDGSHGWLVTIPGTDGHADSPFGWSQNGEAMSGDADQRQRADSVRMVVAAMEGAGIGADEPVALVGHSQGGIVAAAVAADCTDRFRVEHVVTAGSPVAGHPIGADTWVTSVEMEDELVAALDGASNPASESWLTVRGAVTDSDADDRLLSGAVVPDAIDGNEFTHYMKYHEAAWANASDLGSPAVTGHEEHFRSCLAATYAGTTYWQGRMGRGGTGLTVAGADASAGAAAPDVEADAGP
ncbi:MAG: alpha/beta hydrolase, partial [Bifidobacterium sp.]|nr:alpha/beta hydrolase [Bifidobacterium sp.]